MYVFAKVCMCAVYCGVNSTERCATSLSYDTHVNTNRFGLRSEKRRERFFKRFACHVDIRVIDMCVVKTFFFKEQPPPKIRVYISFRFIDSY